MFASGEPTAVVPGLAGEICTHLRHDGIWVSNTLFGTDEIACAIDAVRACELVKDRVGAKLLLERADEKPEFEFFFRSSVVADVMKVLIGAGAISRRNRIQTRTDRGVEKSPIVLFHIDSPSPRYKAFLYLSEVGEEDGPLEFLRRSHEGSWRDPYVEEVKLALSQNATDEGIEELDYSGCLRTDVELTTVLASHERIRVTGAAGTCIIFDTRGFHRASPMGSGSRLILSMDWMGPDLVI
jgi:hypothetical protein